MNFAYVIAVLLVLGHVNSENSTEDTCEAGSFEPGPWSSLLEEWATSTYNTSDRRGRILALPPSSGYYVTERIDIPLTEMLPPAESPPPKAHAPRPAPPRPYVEWQPPPPHGPGKIVNRPTNPNKDKFKPSYPPPSPPAHNQPAGAPQRPGGGPVDRVDEPPRKQVTETDLYLLGAIEKLVYRVDFMEKRLRKMEESMHYLVAGADPKPEPCVANFTRIGAGCYHVSSSAADWKTANLACRRLRANLLEIDTETEKRKLTAAFLTDKSLRGEEWWTGGLNPGLLWIWSHSGRPLASNTTDSAANTVVGEGRCLALVLDPALNVYVYRGQDCAFRHRYVCEKEEDKTRLSNEIERVARAAKLPAGSRSSNTSSSNSRRARGSVLGGT